MNKTELVDQVASEADLTKVQATAALNSILGVIQNALKSEDRVTLVGFGAFMVTKRAARVGRNPRTGKELAIPAASLPRFRPGKALKDAVSPPPPPPPPPPAATTKKVAAKKK